MKPEPVTIKSSLYIELLKTTLTDYQGNDHTEDYLPLHDFRSNWKLIYCLRWINGCGNGSLPFVNISAITGRTGQREKDWPTRADTMIGLKRLENIESCFRKVIKDNIPGDFIETGVWRGGATIFMRALLKDAGIENKIVWVADSFEGLPSRMKKNMLKIKAIPITGLKNLRFPWKS